MVVTFHGILNVFRASIGTGTAIMELNMAQELASIEKKLFLVFLDVWKSYYTLDRGIILQKLEGYRAGLKMRLILAEFWENQEVVTSKNSYHGTQFRATRGTTQGGIVLPTLFNVTFDILVRHWLSLTVEEYSLVVFYADDVLLGSWDP